MSQKSRRPQAAFVYCIRIVIIGFFLSLLPWSADSHMAKAQGSCSPLDMVLLIDSTGSMGGAIDNVKAAASKIVDEIVAAAGDDYQLGLLEFRDNVVVLTDMAPGTAGVVKTRIAAIQAIEGDNEPEASDEALNTVINRLSADGRQQSGNFSGTWRAGSNKIIVLITDASPGGFNDLYEPGIDDVNASQRANEAKAAGIRISAVYVPTHEGVSAASPSTVNDVSSGLASIAESIMRVYASVTDGGFIRTASNGAGTANAVSITIRACGKVGEVDLSPGSEPVQVPEPITVVLFGSGLAGLAGYVRHKRKQLNM